jgi:hypothetical protein
VCPSAPLAFASGTIFCSSASRRLLAAIHDPAAIERVLGAMGVSAVAPAMAAARSPPGEAELPG